jgi:hypothetical protein
MLRVSALYGLLELSECIESLRRMYIIFHSPSDPVGEKGGTKVTFLCLGTALSIPVRGSLQSGCALLFACKKNAVAYLVG